MKNLGKSLGVLVYFIVAQCIGTIALFLFKIKTDSIWVDKLYNSITINGVLSKEYFQLVGELLIPSLIIADCLIIIPFLINSYRTGNQLMRSMSLSLAIKLFILGCALNTVVSLVVESLPASATTNEYSSLMNLVVADNIFISFLTNAVLAALVEEILFRKMIIGFYVEKSGNLAIVMSALLFGLMHMNPIQSTYAFILGLIMGYIYIKTEYNLLSTFIVHVTINGTSILYEYLPSQLQSVFLYLGALSVIATVTYLAFMFLRRDYVKEEMIG